MRSTAWVVGGVGWLVTLGGCFSGIPCKTSADCEAGRGVCDAALKICVVRTSDVVDLDAAERDGGRDSGAPFDGGLEDEGSRDGGGGDDAGVDGGDVDGGETEPEAACRPACGAREACVLEPDAGAQCQPLTLSFLSPSPDSEFDVGSEIIVRIQAQLPDGGTVRNFALPLRSDFGTAAQVVSGMATATAIAIPSSTPGGPHTLTAGWDDGPKASLRVYLKTCARSCAAWQACATTREGGVCVDDQVLVAWESPTSNTALASGQWVSATVRLTKADGGVVTQAEVPVTGPTGVTTPYTCSGGLCTGLVGYLTGADGTKTYTAGWPASGRTAALSLRLDTTPPSFELMVGGGASHLRDEVVPALLVAGEPVAGGSLSFGGIEQATVPMSQCDGLTTAKVKVACFMLDFSAPVLNALRGSLPVQFGGADSVGNTASQAGPPLDVSRIRWERTISGYWAAAPAIGQDGTIYVGGNVGGSLQALTPKGEVKWDAGVGGLESLAVGFSNGKEVVYYAAGRSTGAVQAEDGQRGSIPAAMGSEGENRHGLALVALPGETAAVGAFNSVRPNVKAKLVVFGDSSGGTAVDVDFDSPVMLDVPGMAYQYVPVNVVVDGTTALFLPQGNSGLRVQPVNGLGASVTFGTFASVGSGFWTQALGQALLSSGTSTFGVGSSNPGIYRYDGAVHSGTTGGPTYGPPVLLTDTVGYIGAGNQLMRFNPTTSVVGAPVGAFAGESTYGSPVLGQFRPPSLKQLGYVVGNKGTLMVFDSITGALEWQESLGVSLMVEAHPNLDCSRTGSRTTGTLYVPGRSRLIAVIVDSPGLDTYSVWPKYQRTAGNAGNHDGRFPIGTAGCP